MSQQVLIEALTEELYDVIDKYADSMPLAALLGILDVIKFELLESAASQIEDEDDE